MVGHPNPLFSPLMINFSCQYHHVTSLKNLLLNFVSDCSLPPIVICEYFKLPLKYIPGWLRLTTLIAVL